MRGRYSTIGYMQMIGILAVCTLIGYVCGSWPTGVIVGAVITFLAALP